MPVEQLERTGRTLLIGLGLWTGVGLAALATLELVFPARKPAPALVAPPCTSSVPSGPYDAAKKSEPARSVIAAPSWCDTAGTTTDPQPRLHAYLEGAELESAPANPPPAVDPALRARGASLYAHHCAACHGATGDGAGPDACALETPAAVHKSGVFALRTTEHEELPTDEDLFRTITRGVHGTAMPPWFALAEPDRWALVVHVKSLSKQFDEETAPPSLSFGKQPDATDERILAGQELYRTRGCSSCHGDGGRGDGIAARSLVDKPRDFTSGYFHRGSSAAEIHETIVTGLDGTPMGSFAKVMTEDELWNVSLYVHRLAPPTRDRNGLRCPIIARPVNTQELFGIRHLVHTMQLESGS